MGVQDPWIGMRVKDCVLVRRVGEGAYSWIFEGTTVDGGFERAIKVAKRHHDIGPPAEAGRRTSCREVYTGGSAEVIPNGPFLLGNQRLKLMKVDDPAVVTVHGGGITPGPGPGLAPYPTTYCVMEMLDGRNMRDWMADGAVPIQWLISISDALSRLASTPGFGYHGDLKPENIMIVGSDVKLIDPGYFGELEVAPVDADWSAAKATRDVVVTTPLYYPSLVPNDMFAFGLMLWELACKRHPLADHRPAGLFDMYRFARSERPRTTNPELAESLEAVILKCLGLQAVGDHMEFGPEFADFGELSRALIALRSARVG